ncbi:MAG: rRNA maturation RNase YbeY [Cyanobacteria bacterium P01_C01_bin.118]
MTAVTEQLHLELWVEIAEPLVGKVSKLPTTETWQSWFVTWLGSLGTTTLSPINSYEVSLLLTDDVHIQQLNATYRQQDKATDVLAFAAQEVDLPGAQAMYATAPLPLGDIVISVETAQRQRHDANYSLLQELSWLAAHGFLHLLGWDHPDETSLKIMLEQQECLLKQIDLQS